MMMPAPVAALTTPLYRLATSARLRCKLLDRPEGPPSDGAFWLLLPAPAAAALLLLLAALPASHTRDRHMNRWEADMQHAWIGAGSRGQGGTPGLAVFPCCCCCFCRCPYQHKCGEPATTPALTPNAAALAAILLLDAPFIQPRPLPHLKTPFPAPDKPPACIRTFMVSSGCMVD